MRRFLFTRQPHSRPDAGHTNHLGKDSSFGLFVPSRHERRANMLARYVSVALACLSITAPSFAGTATFTGDFSLGGGVNTVNGGAGNLVIEKQITVGPQWNTSGSFGGTVTGAFGDTYGLQVNTATSGKVQLDLGYHSTSGLFTAQTPLSLKLVLPDQIRPGETFKVVSEFSFLRPSSDPFVAPEALRFQTTSSDFGFRAGIAIATDMNISGRTCLVNCESFNIELASFSVDQELLSFNYDNTAPTLLDSFDQEIILLRGSALEAPITDLVRNAATAAPIPLIEGPTGNLLTLTYGNAGQTTLFPVARADGTYSEGASIVAASARADVFRLNANLGQIATAVSGGSVPPLEGTIKSLLKVPDRQAGYDALPQLVKDVLDTVKYNLLRAELGVAVGFQQNFELDVPDVMLDLTLRGTGQTYSFLAGGDGNITLPETFFDNPLISGLTFDVNARLLPTLVDATTDLTLTPLFTLTGPRLQIGPLKTPLIEQAWELPNVAINIEQNQFAVQFQGGLTSPNQSIGTLIDRARSIINLTANNGLLDIAGPYTNTIIRPDQSVAQVRTVADVDLLNSLIGSGAAPVLSIDHDLKLRGGSQLGTAQIRIGETGNISATRAQIGRSDQVAPGSNAMMDIYLGGTIAVNAITETSPFGVVTVLGGGNLQIESANVLPDFNGGGQGSITVQGPLGLGSGTNRLGLSNVGLYQAALDVGAKGLVELNSVLAPTRFIGERVFALAGSAGGSVRNLNVINLRSGTLSIETGLLQSQGNSGPSGFFSVGPGSTLELRSNLSGGFVGLLPGSALKLYENSALDSRVRVEGSNAQVVVMGDAVIDGSNLKLNGAGGLRPVLTTDHAGLNEAGQPGVSSAPHLQLKSAGITLEQSSLRNAAGARISAEGATRISLAVSAPSVQGFGNVHGPVGTIENYGLFELATGDQTITRYQTNATNVLPALTNFSGATFAVNAGQNRISGGLLNYGDVTIGTTPGQPAGLRFGNEPGFDNLTANHDFIQHSGTTTIGEGGSLDLQSDATLYVNGGAFNFFGQRLAGRMVNNGGVVTIDTAHSQSPGLAQLIGDFTQAAGELVLGGNQLFGGLNITGIASFGGILDLTAFQSGIDGLVGGFDFTVQHGEQFQALSFGASLSRFGAYRLPDVDTFYWLPVYSDTALSFRLQDPSLTSVNITSVVQGFQSKIGVVPNMPETVTQTNAQLELAAQLQIGNSFNGDGVLNITDALLKTHTTGILIESTGHLNALNNSLIRAFGNITVNGGSLQLLDNSHIEAAANGISLIAMNGADVRHDGGGYEIPANGSIRVESGAHMFINGSLDFANVGGALLRVTGPGSTLTAAPNGELSEWFVPLAVMGEFRGEVDVSNGGTLNIGSIAAAALFDFTIDVTGPNSLIQQTAAASLDIGRSSSRNSNGRPGVKLTLANGGRFVSGAGGVYFGTEAELHLNGGTFSANSDLDIAGAAVNGSGLALELNGHDLNVFDRGVLNFNTPLALSRGSVVRLISDAHLNALSIDIGTANESGGGGLTAEGLTFIDTDPTQLSRWGNAENSAQVQLLDGVVANFGHIEMAGPGTSMIIGSDLLSPTGNIYRSQVSTGDLGAGTLGGLDSQVLIQLNGGSDLIVNGTLTLGSAAQSAALLEINGGTLSAAAVNVNATGQAILATGALKTQSRLMVDGELMQSGGTTNGASGNLVIGSEIGSAGNYTLGGTGQLNVRNAFVGDRGVGTFTQSDGSSTLDAYLVIGANAGSDGRYNLSGGNLRADHEFVGDHGIGVFAHDSGLNNVLSNLVLGANVGSQGTYELRNNGLIFATNEYIGDHGTGIFNHAGGNNFVSSLLVIGANPGSVGAYNLSGATNGTISLETANAYIGDRGTGNFNQSGGRNTVGANLVLGANSGSQGTYALSDGLLLVGSAYIGSGGTGAFIHTGGALGVTNTLFVGGTDGLYEMSGNSNITAKDLSIGYLGSGRFHQTGGENLVASTLYLAAGGASGAYTLDGGTLRVGSIVNGAGNGTFNFNGGELILTGPSISVENFDIGTLPGTDAGLRLTAGQSLAAGMLGVANAGSYLATGTVADLDGGTIAAALLSIANGATVTSRGGWVGSNVGTANSTSVVLGAEVTGAGSLWQSRFLNIGVDGDGRVTVANGGTVSTTNNLILGGTVGRAGVLAIDAGGIVETGVNGYVGRASASVGSVVLEGAGATWNVGDSIFLGGDNLIAGGTGTLTIRNGGTVNVANKVKFWDGGNLLIETGGTLNAGTIDAGDAGLVLTGGTFAVDSFNGNLINQGAILAPGNSPGITQVFGNYSQGINATLQIEIGGVLPGLGGHDALHVTGLAEFSGTLVVELFDFSGTFFDTGTGIFAPRLGDSFDIVRAEEITGDFDFFTLALLGGGLGWEINHLVDRDGTIDVLQLSVVSAVPLPGAVWLFGCALTALFTINRQRLSKSAVRQRGVVQTP